jgi:hypothetical protein
MFMIQYHPCGQVMDHVEPNPVDPRQLPQSMYLSRVRVRGVREDLTIRLILSGPVLDPCSRGRTGA